MSQDTQLYERTSDLIKDADKFKADLINEIEMMYKDLNKFNNKNVTSAALRLRVRLMSFKKFADIARKDIQARVREIKQDRKKVDSEAETAAAETGAQGDAKPKKKRRGRPAKKKD